MPLSPRLAEILDALPLKRGLRILEIGCGTGALARAIVGRMEGGFVLGIDRSTSVVRRAVRVSRAEVMAGRLAFRTATVEEFRLDRDDAPFDLAIAVDVGALDGRDPEAAALAIPRIAAALKPGGKLLINGGKPLRSVPLPR